MAKFCGNCGAELADDAKVCGQCGTPLESGLNSHTVKIVDPEKQAKTKKRIKLGLGAVALIIVAVISVNIISSFTGSNGLLKKVMNAYAKYDVDALVAVSSDMYYYGYEDFVEYYFENSIGNDLDYFESYVGHNYKLNYEIQEVYTLSGRKLDTILDTIKSSYPDFDTDIIAQVKAADIKVTAKEGKSSVSKSVQVTMTKENGKWKLLYID